MIVNYTEAGWLIITQRSHSLLASQICAHWKKANQPDRWVETLIATAEHDDANNELDQQNLLEDTGGPVNFKMVPFEEDYCNALLDMALCKGRYIALLISRHIRFLYGKEAKASSYCRGLQEKEKTWMAETKATRTEIDRSYKLLEFCDAFSLLICQQAIQPEGRKTEISNGPDGKSYVLKADDRQRLIVSPWPFEVDSFRVNYESRTVAQLTFRDTDEFKKVFFSAPVELHEIQISRGK